MLAIGMKWSSCIVKVLQVLFCLFSSYEHNNRNLYAQLMKFSQCVRVLLDVIKSGMKADMRRETKRNETKRFDRMEGTTTF